MCSIHVLLLDTTIKKRYSNRLAWSPSFAYSYGCPNRDIIGSNISSDRHRQCIINRGCEAIMVHIILLKENLRELHLDTVNLIALLRFLTPLSGILCVRFQYFLYFSILYKCNNDFVKYIILPKFVIFLFR